MQGGSRTALSGARRALATVEKETEFTNVAAGMESIHDLVPTGFGGRRGTMSQLDRAPGDPLFWMHHVTIGRLVWDWHNSTARDSTRTCRAPTVAIMGPSAFAEYATHDLVTVNYTYA